MNSSLHLWLLPLLPLAGFLCNGTLGRRLPKSLVTLIALLASGAAFAQVLWIASRWSTLAAVSMLVALLGWVHSLSKSIWSTFSVLRERKTAMMMAKPTAASAAATTMTKKTKIWPVT